MSLQEFLNSLNSKGIPVPTIRDPKTGEGSLTATMVVVSFGICVLMLAGKVTKILGDVDYDNALWLLGLSVSTYLGRQYQKNGRQINIGNSNSSEGESNGDSGTSK